MPLTTPRDLLPCGYATNGGVWVRWAIGITAVAVMGVVGFQFKETAEFAALKQKVEDQGDEGRRDRAAFSSDMRREFDQLHNDINRIKDKAPDAPAPARRRYDANEYPKFGPQ